MSDILITKKITPSTPSTNKVKIYVNTSGNLESVDDTGTVKTYSTGITAEQVQDIVGVMIVDTSSIDVTYDDVGNTISMQVIQTAIDHQNLQNKGTNSHAQIDSHIASTGNPHSVTKAQVGLSNVDNTSDLNKPISTATQTALNGKENTITAGLTSQYFRGDKSFQTLDKTAVGLSNVDNTSDANKPVSTATQTALNLKENSISAGLTSQYWRGDKTFQTLDKNAVGLSNVDNTSDLNKPISTATQVALNAKYDASNPNNYETPVQLNARDTANRARANHTGTQLASTISDFSSSTLGVLLTGISFLTNSAILATDSILIAFGKIQTQLNAHFGSGGTAHALATGAVSGFMSALDKTKLDGIISDVILFTSSALTNTSNTTFVTIPQLQINVTAGSRYRFKASILFDTNANTTGIGLSMGGTATGLIRSMVEIPTSNNATTTNKICGPISALNGVVTSNAVGTAGLVYLAEIEGVFRATTSGLIYPQFRSEVNGVQVRVNIDSNMVYKEY